MLPRSPTCLSCQQTHRHTVSKRRILKLSVGAEESILGLPGWASPGIRLGPRGHADLLSLVNDPSVYILCRQLLKLLTVFAETVSSSNMFQMLIILAGLLDDLARFRGGDRGGVPPSATEARFSKNLRKNFRIRSHLGTS